MTWTPEQIISLAPDASSASAGRGLASSRHWVSAGCTARAIWGECQGSGARPYQVQIDLIEPAFKCSCPSRKFPCKHGIGLFLLWANDNSAASQTEQPEWVNEWLAKRDTKSEVSDKKSQQDVPVKVVDSVAQEKRAADRESRIAAGLDELELWLGDLIRGGLAAAQSQPVQFWLNMAARMVDAQAPGLARRVREMAGVPATGAGWEGRLLEQIAGLRLVLEGYRRMDAQSEAMQDTIRTHVGWTIKQDELIKQAGTRSEWLVVGKQYSDEDKLRVQRTWLMGATGSALLLHFAVRGQPMEVTPVVGAYIDAELVYFPGTLKQRAAIKTTHGESARDRNVSCSRDFDTMLGQFAAAVAVDPWTQSIVVGIAGVTPMIKDNSWKMHDYCRAILPISSRFPQSWRLLSVSGGRPVTLFAEWDGRFLTPMSAVADGRFVSLSPSQGT